MIKDITDGIISRKKKINYNELLAESFFLSTIVPKNIKDAIKDEQAC